MPYLPTLIMLQAITHDRTRMRIKGRFTRRTASEKAAYTTALIKLEARVYTRFNYPNFDAQLYRVYLARAIG